MALDHLIIIDGYNLVLRSPELKPGPDRTLRQSREKLLSLLSWAFGESHGNFLVVFDGQDASKDQVAGGRVEVRFARAPETADDLIRKLVEDRIERVERLTVVTSDLEVARHARAMGAAVSMADLFIASALGPQRQGAAPEKPGSLSKRELEEWAEIFRTRPRPQEDAE